MEAENKSTPTAEQFEALSFRAAVRWTIRLGAASDEKDATAKLIGALAVGGIASRGITYDPERIPLLKDSPDPIPPNAWDECPFDLFRGVAVLREPGFRLPRWRDIEIDAVTLRRAFRVQPVPAAAPQQSAKKQSAKPTKRAAVADWLRANYSARPVDTVDELMRACKVKCGKRTFEDGLRDAFPQDRS
jgi:hypothetical protein